MNNLFNKVKLLFQRPTVIIVMGKGKETAFSAITKVLKTHFDLGKSVLIYSIDSALSSDLKFMIKNSKMVILVATHTGQYESEKEFFSGDTEIVANIAKVLNLLGSKDRLIFNFDDETVRDLKNQGKSAMLAFGFAARADIRVSDPTLTESPNLGTNFKINFEGNIVPVWLPNLFGKEEIYAALAAAAVGEILGLNLVEISGALKLTKPEI